MKYTVIFFVLFLASCQKKETGFVKSELIPSKIDNLATDRHAEDYLYAIDTNYRPFHIAAFQDRAAGTHQAYIDSINKRLASRYKVTKGFYKEDFDNNGYTDVLIVGGWGYEPGNPPIIGFPDALVLLTITKDSTKILHLGNMLEYPFVPEVIHKGGEPMIAIHTLNREPSKTADGIKKDTTLILAYRHGNLVEENQNLVKHNIEKIQFAAEPCFGKCPIFEITINDDKSAWFIAQAFNFDKEWDAKGEGAFRTIIKQADYDRLVGLLNYMDFPKMKNEYYLTATDLPGAKLIITYDGGKTKTISDYGREGTYGLRALYQLMMDLRFNQDWKKAPEPTGLRINKF